MVGMGLLGSLIYFMMGLDTWVMGVLSSILVLVFFGPFTEEEKFEEEEEEEEFYDEFDFEDEDEETPPEEEDFVEEEKVQRPS